MSEAYSLFSDLCDLDVCYGRFFGGFHCQLLPTHRWLYWRTIFFHAIQNAVSEENRKIPTTEILFEKSETFRFFTNNAENYNFHPTL